MRRLWPLCLTLLLLGCPTTDDDDSSVADDDDAVEDDDDSVADDDDSVADDDDSVIDDDDAVGDAWLFEVGDDVQLAIQVGLAIPAVGYNLWNGQVGAAQQAGDPCPTLAQAAGVLTVTTDCTDLQGRAWTGQIVAAWVDGDPEVRSMEYTDFAITAPNGSVVVSLHGSQVITGEDLMVPATRVITQLDTSATLQISAQPAWQGLTFTHTGTVHTGAVSALPPFDDLPSDPVDHEGTIQVAGEVDVWERGTFAITATDVVQDADCDREGSSGVIVLTGANIVTATLDGAIECDGCFPYVSDDGLDDEICPE